jgi:hypothetical protein
VSALLLAITAALNAYVAWCNLQRETHTDRLEDEIDRLADDGSPAAKLRLLRLGQRLARERQRAV